jgi:hypothetical protein
MSDIVKEIVKSDYIEKGMMTAAGLGREIYKLGKYDDMSVRDTYQYALEVIIHQKLLNSPYRTKNPDEADLFYVPGSRHHAFFNVIRFHDLFDDI